MHPSINHIKALLKQILPELPPSQHHVVDEIHKELAKLSHALVEKPVPEHHATVDAATGCYQFEHDAGLYCPHCYDRQQLKTITQRINSKLRVCPQCRSSLKASKTASTD